MFKMWQFVEAGFLILLGISALNDRKEQKVSMRILLAMEILSVIKLISGEISLPMWFAGASVGVFFVFFSKYTKEELGYGDSVGMIVMGTFLGVWKLFIVLFLAFLILGVVSVIQIRRKSWRRATRVPLFPFLLVSYVCGMGW